MKLLDINLFSRLTDFQIALLLIGVIVLFLMVGLIKGLVMPNLFGKAAWATRRQMAKIGLFTDGVLLAKFKGKFVGLPGELFTLVAAPTRSGKGVGLVIPNLLSWAGSAVVLDIKLENFGITSKFRQNCGQDVFAFVPAAKDKRTHCYNPLFYVSDDLDHRVDDIQKISNYLIPTPPNTEPMWSAEARDLFLGLCLMVIESDEIPSTIGEMLRQLKTEKESVEHFTYMMHRYNLSDTCCRSLNNYINKATKERSGVKSTVTSALSIWANPLVDAATSRNDFDLRKLRSKLMTIYVGVTPDNLSRMAPLVNLFMQHLMDLNTQELEPKDKKHQVLLVMDEFTAIGRMEILEKSIGFIAGYGLRLLTIIQSPAQLRAIYGNDVAETMIQNHAARVIFRPETFEEAEAISKELGDQTVTSYSKSTPMGLDKSGNISRSKARRALALPQEIKAMKADQAIILTSGLPPIKAKKIRYYDDPVFMKRLKGAIEIPEVRRHKVSKEPSYKTDIILHDRTMTKTETSDVADAFFNELMAACAAT